MRLLMILVLTVLFHIPLSYCQAQTSKLEGYVIGKKGGEKYIIYFNGQWIMTFEAEAYKLSFEVERLSYWEESGYIKEFAIYRETMFGRKKVHFHVPYDGAKRYLIIARERKRSKRHGFVGTWSDEEPKFPE